jgi:uncharacterized membrane protein YcaP (DUF421 family)
MNWLIQIFGEGKDLNSIQMACRGVIVFLIALALIRIAGRRSFGLRTPFDNIIMILLGAILSRAVVGASAFLPTVITSTVIALLHRIFGHIVARNDTFGNLVEGKKILLFKNGRYIAENMKRALVCKEDILQGVRKSALTDNMEKIDAVYMERNGEISSLEKQGTD